MSRALITLVSIQDRERAARWAMKMKPGTRLEFKEAKRSIPQNDLLWAMLTDVATQLPWHGLKLTPQDWKFIFLDALRREVRVVPNIDGTGFVNIARSSSNLSKAEFSDLIELIHAFGADHGVVFTDQELAGSAQPVNNETRADKPTPGQSDSPRLNYKPEDKTV